MAAIFQAGRFEQPGKFPFNPKQILVLNSGYTSLFYGIPNSADAPFGINERTTMQAMYFNRQTTLLPSKGFQRCIHKVYQHMWKSG
ncbi:MAG: hypothetical protein EA392_01385 [Cryomorphaceae bacterium]|nr:MAG: hypothetical protein EA392_01385 [Cryomorphaceae bacterium]